MRLSYAVSLLPLAASVGALQVTEPKKGEDVDLSKSFTVKWDAVDTDPSSFDLYIVNNAVYPSVEQKIASDVDSSKGSYSVSGLSDLTNGKGYQINFLSNSAKNSGILAQSQQFNVEGSSDSSSSASASETKTASSTTGTATASSTGTTSSTETASSKTASSTGHITTATQSLTSGVSTVTGTNTLSTTVSSSARASASHSGSASGTSSGSSPVSTGAGASLAAPVSAAVLLMGAVALNL